MQDGSIESEVIDAPGALSVIDQEPDALSLRLGEFRLATYADVLNKASEVSFQLAGIIRDRKLFKRIGDKDHVYVDGWTTCGAMLGVAVRPVSCDENPAKEGEFIATVEAIRTSDGFVLGRGIASCGPDERDWGKRSRQARRSMAQTRAAGKAMRLLFSWVMEMAGYATTPFEEMDREPHDNPEADPNAPPAPAPRGQRSDAPTPEQIKELVRVWQGQNPEPNGDKVQWSINYKLWVCRTTERTFDPTKASNWTAADYDKCRKALEN